MSKDPTDLLSLAVAQSLAGDTRAFARVVDAYERPVFAFVSRMVGNDPVAAELVQEAFLRCFRSLDRVRPGSPIRPWLFRIARNITIDYLRRAEHNYRRQPLRRRASRMSSPVALRATPSRSCRSRDGCGRSIVRSASCAPPTPKRCCFTSWRASATRRWPSPPTARSTR